MRWGITDLVGVCLASLGSVAISSLLLVVNGALVMAMLVTCSAAGMAWVRPLAVQQFILFAAPLGLLVTQWIMIDYVRSVFVRD